jgi:hypothetical protein
VGLLVHLGDVGRTVSKVRHVDRVSPVLDDLLLLRWESHHGPRDGSSGQTVVPSLEPLILACVVAG